MRTAFAAVSAVMLCVATLGAQEKGAPRDPRPADRAARMDEVVTAYAKDNGFMGSVLVVDGDTVLLNKGYGMASLEWSQPNAPDVKFRLGSLTKQFTAALVLLLQQDGKLKIEDPVSKYLPEVPAAWAKITLANLLGHTSGIPNFTNEKDFGAWASSEHTHAEELARITAKPLEFEPGSKFEYSNSNYEVLGMVIEKVSGKTYESQLHERLLDPLGMTDTGLDSDTLVLPKRAQGYMRDHGKLVVARSESLSIPWAAGSMYSTTGDLLKWEHGLFGAKVLSEESLKRMTTPGLGDYGLGVFVRNTEGVRTVVHGGGIEGFNTSLAYVPERRIAVIVLCNMNGGAIGPVSDDLMQVALGRTVMLPPEHKPVPIAKEDLQKFAGVYDLAPGFALTISVGPDGLQGAATGQQTLSLMYQGVVAGHPRFYAPGPDAELEFVPDASGTITSLVLHQNGEHPAKKR
jgi:CubicO group peptidase (beta-lactamase class C family)